MPVSDTRRGRLIRRFSSSSIHSLQPVQVESPEFRSRRPRTSSTAAYPEFHAFHRSDDDFLETHSDGYYPVDVRPPSQRKLTYASLPPSPIHSPASASDDDGEETYPAFQRKQPSPSPSRETPFSLWDYLWEELLATDFDSHQELKWERVSNFMAIPLAIEKVCVDMKLFLMLI